MNIVVKGRTRAELKVSLKPHVNAQVWFFAIFVVWAYRKNDENCQLWLGFSPLFSWRSNFTHWHRKVSRFDWSWYPRCAPRHPNRYEILYTFRLQHHPNWKLSASFVGSQNQCGTFVPWTCHQVCFQFPHSVFLRTWHQLLFFVFSVFGEVKPFEERRARHLDDALYLVYTGAAWKRVTIPNCSMNYFMYSLPWMVGHY